VTECHREGVIHGDIKAENIIVDLFSNKIRIIDFGSGNIVQQDF
jgi:calcium/calmodulin-dependent protein kinase I